MEMIKESHRPELVDVLTETSPGKHGQKSDTLKEGNGGPVNSSPDPRTPIKPMPHEGSVFTMAHTSAKEKPPAGDCDLSLRQLRGERLALEAGEKLPLARKGAQKT